MLKRLTVFTSLLLIPVLLAASDTGAASASEAAEIQTSDYIINSSDLLHFQVFQEEDLTRQVRVSQSGNITLPMVGTIEVKGKTVEEAQRLLTERYDADFLVNPQINLSVIEYSRRTVNVLGSVNAPGTVPFPPEDSMTLMDAISAAGGFQRSGNRRNVILRRTTENGVQRYSVDTHSIIQGDSPVVWQLQPGDQIYVPERIW